MDAKWLQKHCTKPCSAKIRNNGNQYSIHLHLCMMHRLLFHKTIIVNSIQFKFICIALFMIQSLQSALQEIKFLQYIYTL